MSKNLVNGDSLKKYHIGVNTPNISEELINENVTSFKVGTSNVNGTDLTNQMEQSLVTLDNINGDSSYEPHNFKTVTITDDSNTIELFGLPNGVCDKYINGIVHRNIGSINLSNIKKSDITRVESWDNTNTLMFLIKVPDVKLVTNGSDINCISTHYKCVSDYEIVTNDVVSFAVRLKAKEIMFRVSRGLDTVDRLYDHLTQYEKNITIYYEKETPTEEYVQISYLCKPNDIIDTKSPIPFTCSHQVQFNTKAQVEETQKQIVKSNKSIWQKFKELTDVKMKLENNGYIKLPTAFGGLILQWGTTSFTASGSTRDAWRDIAYPIPFKTRVYHHSATLYSTAWINCGTTGEGLTTLRIWAVGLESGSVLGTEPLYFTWFAIGK